MGALTLKLFSDELREWEFIEEESIDPTDSFGASIRVCIRENQIFLVEPNNEDMPWLTDRGRLFFDGMFNGSNSSELEKTNWGKFFKDLSEILYFADHFNFKTRFPVFYYIVFGNLSLENLNMLYTLEQACSIIKLKKSESHIINNDFESNFLLNTSIDRAKLNLSTVGLLLNTNSRYEGYILNLKLRQRILKGNFKVLTLGSLMNLSFFSSFIGSNVKTLKLLGEGTHLACQDFRNSDFPIVITNTESYKRKDLKYLTKIFKYSNVITESWNGFNVLNHNIGSVGSSYLTKFLPFSYSDYLNFFGIHLVNTSLKLSQNLKKIVELQLLVNFKLNKNYLGANILTNQISPNLFYDQSFKQLAFKNSTSYFNIPSKLFLEDDETFINTQGLIKRVTKSLNYTTVSKSNWQIVRKILSVSKKVVFLSSLKNNSIITIDSTNLFNYKNYVNFQFYACQSLTFFNFYLVEQLKPSQNSNLNFFKERKIKLFETKLKNWLDDFFLGTGSNTYSHNSSAMATLSKSVRVNSSNFF